MTVQRAVNDGPPATFGPLTFKGREAVEESYLRRLAEWPQGGAYDQRVLRDLQRQFSRSEAHTSELQSLMRISYAVFCLKKKREYMTDTETIKVSTIKLNITINR